MNEGSGKDAWILFRFVNDVGVTGGLLWGEAVG
jgi:hypothetical protein